MEQSGVGKRVMKKFGRCSKVGQSREKWKSQRMEVVVGLHQ